MSHPGPAKAGHYFLVAASRNPSYSARNSPVRQKFSGCHWTPTQKRADGILDRLDDAVRRRGGHAEAGRRPS